MNFLDILITSPQYFIRKIWGQDRRIWSLILGVKGLIPSFVATHLIQSCDKDRLKWEIVLGNKTHKLAIGKTYQAYWINWHKLQVLPVYFVGIKNDY